MTAVETIPLPWNPDDVPKATRDLTRLKADIDEWGFCFIEQAFEPAKVASIQMRLTEQAEAERATGYHRPGVSVQDPEGQNQWITMLINKGAVLQGVLFHPLITGVMDHLLGREHVLSEMSSHITRPGNSLLPFHTDQWWMPQPRLPGEPYRRAGDITRGNATTGLPERATTPINPPMAANAMCMISDFTAANGATRLVPMSHLSGLQPEACVPHKVPSIAAEGRAGDVVISEGRTWHAAGENATNAARYGLVTHYAGPQVRTLQNFTLGTKAEVLANATPELRKLLGFKVWSGYGETGPLDEEFARPADELIGELWP